jgi:hypothetical protein
MTDLPNSAADRAAKASSADIETPAGDPELAALVRRDPPPDDATEPAFDVTSAAADSTSPDPDEPAPVAANTGAA